MKSSGSPKIPTAKHSTLTSLTLLPTNSSEYHPTISHSHLYRLTLDSLSPSTTIRHTFIRHSTQHHFTEPYNPLHNLKQQHRLQQLARGYPVERTVCIRFSSAQLHPISLGRVSQCKIISSQILGTPKENDNTPNAVTNTTKTEINKSDIRDSTIGPLPCTINRSRLGKVKVSQSTINDACLDDCDVDGCRILKGKFSGLWLRNGIWEGGELVGKVTEGEEVVVKARNFAEIEEMERRRELERARKVEEGGERRRGIGVGLDKGVEDHGSKCGLQGEDAFANPPQIPPPHFDSLVPITTATSTTAAAAAAAAHNMQYSQLQQAPPPASKKQPHISMKEDYPPSLLADDYSSAAESLLDSDGDAEITHEAIPDVVSLAIADEKPPPYAP
ncbi:hypothetical protein ACJ72_01523 [Emergomyces africanus]|uniref:Uncharacterized protein n=1 Tax=Emergomyces africanus TaxID=1955775 RepID=A0A1B7P4Z2_9EURO|nr:hypothetical protein ACJ72_01523 [Emergomyces africanus]